MSSREVLYGRGSSAKPVIVDGGGMTTLQRYSRAQTSPSSHYTSELIQGGLISPGLRSARLPFISKEKKNTNKNVSGSVLKMHEMRSSSPVVITASLARRARAVIK